MLLNWQSDENDGCYRVQHMHCIVTVWTVSLLECSLSITELLHNCVHTCFDFQVGAHIFTKWKGCILHTGQSKIERISYYDVLETEDSMLKSFTNYCPCHCYKCFSFSWRVFVTIVRFFKSRLWNHYYISTIHTRTALPQCMHFIIPARIPVCILHTVNALSQQGFIMLQWQWIWSTLPSTTEFLIFTQNFLILRFKKT